MPLIAGLDIETTGLLDKETNKPGDQRIIEVCVQLWDTDTGARRLNYVQRIDPQRSITAGAAAVHGITASELVGKPLWNEVAPKVVAVLSKAALVVAHNGEGFDRPFVEEELKRIGIKPPRVPWFDTMLEGRWATPTGAVPSLQALCFACGVDYDTTLAHAASYDVDRMMQCLLRALRWGKVTLPETALRLAG